MRRWVPQGRALGSSSREHDKVGFIPFSVPKRKATPKGVVFFLIFRDSNPERALTFINNSLKTSCIFSVYDILQTTICCGKILFATIYIILFIGGVI